MGFVRREAERFAPLPQSDEKGKQATPLLRQHIFLVRAAIGGGNEIHNPMFDEIMEARRQDVLGEPKAPLKFPEPPRAIERIADDQKRPPVTDRVQGPRHRTGGTLMTRPLSHLATP